MEILRKPSALPVRALIAESDMSKTRILVVDDEPAIVEVLAYNLNREGFEVTTAADGREALQKCQSSPPDLIILDLMMPHMDGLQVCRKLKSEARTQGIRILMLTAKGDETDEIVGFSLGADDFVAKPFRVKPLIERVKALLRRRDHGADVPEIVRIANIEIDKTNHIVRKDGVELSLTSDRVPAPLDPVPPAGPDLQPQRTAGLRPGRRCQFPGAHDRRPRAGTS